MKDLIDGVLVPLRKPLIIAAPHHKFLISRSLVYRKDSTRVLLSIHIDQLRMLITEYQFDVLAISETKLDSTITDGLVRISGYTLERNDRNINGSGVALYIRGNVDYVVRRDLVPGSLEMIAVEISKPNAKSFIISTCRYKPPDTPIALFTDFENFLKSVNSKDPMSAPVKFLYEGYQFCQLIKDYTRLTSHSIQVI